MVEGADGVWRGGGFRGAGLGGGGLGVDVALWPRVHALKLKDLEHGSLAQHGGGQGDFEEDLNPTKPK